jgi:hypothetical protein
LRSIELALGVAAGSLPQAAGYLDLTRLDDERVELELVTTDFDDAIEHLRAAATLDLGVRLVNRWRRDPDGSSTREWSLGLYFEGDSDFFSEA